MPSDAVAKFQSCRWRCDPDAGAFCTHRDVLPFAGKEGFVADSWCPDCGFYKLRRTPKKRDYSSTDYGSPKLHYSSRRAALKGCTTQ